MLNIFSCDYWPSVSLLGGNVYLGLLPIFWVVCFFSGMSCMSCLYILEINSLPVVSLALMFSHFQGRLFTLFTVSFAVQKLLSLIRFHLLVFISITLGGRAKKILLWFMSSTALPMFCSKCFIISGLTFRALINFEFIFVYGVRKQVF